MKWNLTPTDLAGALLVLALVVFAVPWLCDAFGLAMVLDLGTRIEYGLLFSGVHLVRAFLFGKGPAANAIRIALLCGCILLAWNKVDLTPAGPVAVSVVLPDLDDTGKIQRPDSPPVYTNNSTDPRLETALFSVPAWLLNQAETITILEEEAFDAMVQGTTHVAGLTSVATSTYQDHTDTRCHVYLRSANLDMDTVIHELFHCVEAQHGPFDLQAQYERNPRAISRYGATSPSEFFAEAGLLYMKKPDRLKKACPELHSLFQDLQSSISSS